MTKAGTWPQAHAHLQRVLQIKTEDEVTRGSSVLLPCGTLLSEAGASEHILNSFGPSGHLSSESDDPGNTDVRQRPDLCPPDATSTPTNVGTAHPPRTLWKRRP